MSSRDVLASPDELIGIGSLTEFAVTFKAKEFVDEVAKEDVDVIPVVPKDVEATSGVNHCFAKFAIITIIA